MKEVGYLRQRNSGDCGELENQIGYSIQLSCGNIDPVLPYPLNFQNSLKTCIFTRNKFKILVLVLKIPIKILVLVLKIPIF